TNFRNDFNNNVAKGYSKEEAFRMTASEIAVPGTSEHNMGLAIDFNSIHEDFDRTEAYRWLTINAHKYGFILRYPKDKTDITAISYEPWHWRFVGLGNASDILRSGLTLEEYVGTCAGDTSAVEAWKRQLTVDN
ncbi:MAG: M15 family metallopeptidase, partial [Oscillospiraceae bacterium]|nr:M15 family metallopeptidase [Oscillospiraceae bacterium]